MGSATRYRIAVIGAGGIARAHAEALKASADRAECVAVCDINSQRAADFALQHAVPAHYTEVDGMLARENPDLVCICTSPDQHRDLVLRCLEQGCWVLCEKPLCGSLNELDAIQAAEKRTGCYCATVFQWRYASATQHLHRLLRENRLGRPLVAQCSTLWYRNQDYYNVSWRGKWDTEFGGPTVGLGIHAVDCLLYLLGDWCEVTAVIARLDRDMELEDVSMALVRFKNGAIASLTSSALSPEEETSIRIDCQLATAAIRTIYGVTNEQLNFSIGSRVTPSTPARTRDMEVCRLSEWQQISGDDPANHTSQLRQIIADMDARRQPLTSGDAARSITELLAALYKSGFTHQPVTRGSIRSGDSFYNAFHGGYRLESSSHQAMA